MAENTYRSLLIDCRGGTGKQACLAHLIPELKKKYKTVSVISPYYDLFQSCADCDMVYRPDQYKSALEDAGDDTYIVIDTIYDTDRFIKKTISYADAYRKICLLDEKGDGKEGMTVKSNLDPLRAFDLTKVRNEIFEDLKKKGYDDFIIFQHTGGQSPLTQVPVENGKPAWDKVPYTGQNNGLSRHYPADKAGKFVELFKKKHPKTAVISYTLPNEPYIQGTERYVVPYLTFVILAKEEKCRGIVTIDSSLQHLTAGLTKTIVMWHHSLPQSFGYSYNLNLITNCKRDGIKYFSALGSAGNRIEYVEPEKLMYFTENYIFGDMKPEYREDPNA